MHHADHYPAIVDFLARIGLPIAVETLPADTFLPGIAVRAGGLVIDPERLMWPGDLLHEAGHLAVLPAAARGEARDDLPDSGEIAHAGELEAMAWAYAAATELRLPMDVLIHDGGYNGKARDLLQMYAFGVYPGLRGLCATGMTTAPGFASVATSESMPGCASAQYPRMSHWLRET